ncbi:MAG TPA: sugar ABC transporter permease [Steroidobacteraceae bacterium]|nr:sugar ABC transporter permease [Steroidobacteraceae bacterium]
MSTTPRLPNTWWRRNQMALAPVIFLGPASLLFTIFVIWPICDSVWLSLYDWDGVKPKTFVGLANYAELFTDGTFYTALLNNLYWLLAYMLAPVFGLALALFLNQTVFGIRLVKSLFFFPFVISQVVVGLVFGWFLNADFGLLNRILTAFGVPAVNILGNENWATFGVILAGLWPQTAYCMILYLTGLTAINVDLIEAARLDGAQGWQMLWHIIIPQLRPATFIAVVVCVVGALRSFDLISIMTKGGPFDSSQVLAYYMYQQTFLSFRYGYGAAIATILFLIMDVYIAFFLVSMLRRERR